MEFQTPQQQKEALGGYKYSTQFENFSSYTAQISTTSEYGHYYSIFTEYPYNEDMDCVARPVLSGLVTADKPVNMNFSVPNGAKKLYVLCGSELTEYPVGDLNLSDQTTRANLSSEEFDQMMDYVDNHLYVEGKTHVFGEDLYKCTDLYADPAEVGEDQVVNVWVSFIRSCVNGKVWYYVYKGDNPSIEDCQFYGYKRSTQATGKLTWSQIKTSAEPDFLIYNGTKKNEELQLGITLKRGEKLGFVWHGNLGWRFTTPSLNCPPNTTNNGTWANGQLWPEDTPIGKTIYKNMDTNGESFTIQQNVFGGCIMHYNFNGKEYNVVGFENRLPGQTTEQGGGNNGKYDADFNDFMFLIRSNPETIKPAEELPIIELGDVKTVKTGMWLFEDNYPETGDFDFNDVVVYYEMSQSNKKKDIVEVTCWLPAYGCSYSNEIGLWALPSLDYEAWATPNYKTQLWPKVTGYKNVRNASIDLSDIQKKTVAITCSNPDLVRPYINNGKGECSLEHYNTGEYPYVLDVPSGNIFSDDFFRWTMEGTRIDDAYYFTKSRNGGTTRDADWYKHVKDESYVIGNHK